MKPDHLTDHEGERPGVLSILEAIVVGLILFPIVWRNLLKPLIPDVRELLLRRDLQPDTGNLSA